MRFARRAHTWLLIHSASNPWTGATWALDGSGRAYNTPPLGSELVANGNLESWASASNANNWSEFPSGTSTVNQESTIVQGGSFSARCDIDASNSTASLQQSITTTVGTHYQLVCWLRASASGKTHRIDFAGTGLTRDPGTTWVEYTQTFVATATSHNVALTRGSATSASLYYDTVSVKSMTLAPLMATVVGADSTLTAAAKMQALTAGALGGVVALLDAVSSPANFLRAYHDGVNTVKLDKCVAGTYTNLVSVSIAFSAGAQIEIRRPSGNTFQLWYNGSQRGTDQTVSDAGIISNTRYGLLSTHSGTLFSEFSLGGTVIPLVFPGA